MALNPASRLQCLDRPDGFVPLDSECSAGWWLSEGRIMCVPAATTEPRQRPAPSSAGREPYMTVRFGACWLIATVEEGP
jgi:hypothetical protein